MSENCIMGRLQDICPLYGESECMVGCECSTCIMSFKGTPGESIGEHIRESDDNLADFFTKSMLSTLVAFERDLMSKEELQKYVRFVFDAYYTEFRLTMDARGTEEEVPNDKA